MIYEAAALWRGPDHQLSAVEVMARTTELATALAGNDPDLFMEYVTPVLSGHPGNGLTGSIWDLSLRQNTQDQTYWYHNLQSDGFGPVYADPDATNPQVRHVWYWAQVAYHNSTILAIIGNTYHETIDNTDGKSIQDWYSGNFGIALGTELKNGGTSPSEVSNIIRNTLTDQRPICLANGCAALYAQ